MSWIITYSTGPRVVGESTTRMNLMTSAFPEVSRTSMGNKVLMVTMDDGYVHLVDVDSIDKVTYRKGWEKKEDD